LDKIKAVAKSHGATVGEYILAHIFKTIAMERAARGSGGPITAMLPVDYRGFLSSGTIRNCAQGMVIVMPETDDFSQALKQLRPQFAKIDADWALDNAVGMAKITGLIRFLPSPIKGRLLKKMLGLAGKGLSTMFTNLGAAGLPAEVGDRLDMPEFVICPTTHEPYVFSCITTGNVLAFTATVGAEGCDIADMVMQALESAVSTQGD